MSNSVRLYDLAQQCEVWSQIESAVMLLVADERAAFLRQLEDVSVRRSRATRSLGCYVSVAGAPQCIRLQFRQEPERLVETLLHEVAHLCDHLQNFSGLSYRGAHRSGWQQWAQALGITVKRTGKSEAVDELYRQRLKAVAVCSGCGETIYRLRRLPANKCYHHRRCGHLLTRL